ncbi:hypothetical protein C0J52_19415 [Blattella germanica]|nr:hypothetical protein C0J52_19415 [Blattella germanica]
MEFPIIIPDLDGDGVNDLITACSFNRTTRSIPTVTFRNNLILISGKMGKIIGQAYTDKECSYISELEAKDTWTIKYLCQKSQKGFTKELSVKKLYLEAMKTQLNASIYRQNPSLKQHQTFNTGSQIYAEVINHNLTLINQGHCPNQCNVSVQVTDKRGNNYNVVSNFVQENTYGMIPAVLVFDNHTGTANDGASFEPISGFVVKFWTWITGNGHQLSTNQKNDDKTSSNPLFRNRLKRSNIFNGKDEKKFSQRHRRSVKPTLQQNPKNESSPHVEIHQLKERVVIFTFNATDSHIVNASLHDITQLCVFHECQPDLTFQEQSLLIADLDEDGTQELISYLTTYTHTDPDGSTSDSPKWHLQSRVRVDRLEAEHPKLYEAVARQ